MGPTFVSGDMLARPSRGTVNGLLCLIRDDFSLQGLLAIGVCIQALFTYFLPAPYAYIPGAALVAASLLPHIMGKLGLSKQAQECIIVPGKTTAFLDFANPVHAGKPPGAPALTDEKRPAQLAVMLIGSRSSTALGALEPSFVEMGEAIGAMVKELSTAPPEADVGFLNCESYIPSTHASGNGIMHCIYWKSYDHIMRWVHQPGGRHFPAWSKFRQMQRERATLASKIGIWHEIFEVSNAEGIYQNMPRMGLGDLWEAVRGYDGRVVYRNSLVTGTGRHASSNGRMGYTERHRAPGAEPEPSYRESEKQ
ncbi:hypothetical protein M422DRAFT_32049 [Sphaerobolus stellatus SS14]|uniref:Uncharacterized protein n=1 Tax=Sphaerobolus stellatus (strain SS14) TaxID=990650 RepID=A0A0C9V1N8_SPHS4|nr:hypothetical protein M422DRAFT_32049 [Sphaerobolus stellatus SS14]